MIKYIKNKISLLDEHTIEVINKSFSSTIVKVAGIIFGLGVSIFLGNTLGIKGLGIIELSNQIVAIFIVVGLFGMSEVVIKQIAIGYSQMDKQHIGNVIYSSLIINILMSVVITIVLIASTPILSLHLFNEPLLTWPLIIALSVMPFQVISRIYSSALIGFGKIWQSNLVNRTLSLTVIGSILILMWFLNFEISVITVAIAFALGRIFVTMSMWLYWKRIFKFKGKKIFIGQQLIRSSLPLLLVTMIYIILPNSSGIILGWFGNVTQVGLYSIASKLSLLTIFLLQITNSAISPKLVSLYQERRIAEMEKMLQQIMKGLVFFSTILILIYIFAGKQILTFWGKEFIDAYWILIILSIGQLINLSTSATGIVLIMCGFEKLQGKISLTILILHIILSFILIYYFGIIGAATATTISIVAESITRVIYVKKKVGIHIFSIRIKGIKSFL